MVYWTKDGTMERSLLLINLEQPQYSFTEAEVFDNDTWIHYNPKAKTVWKKIYNNNINEWHRLSWARDLKTFYVAYSQAEPLDGDGLCDHGVFFGTGSLSTWPGKKGNLGVAGRYPATLSFTYLQIGGGWSGDRLNNGTRFASRINFTGTLDVALTAALNGSRDILTTNKDAKDWLYAYFDGPLAYTTLPDVNE